MPRSNPTSPKPASRYVLAASAVFVLIAGVCLSGAVAVPFLPDRSSSEAPAELPFDDATTITVPEVVETTISEVTEVPTTVAPTTTTTAAPTTTTTAAPTTTAPPTTPVPATAAPVTQPVAPGDVGGEGSTPKKVPEVVPTEPGDI